MTDVIFIFSLGPVQGFIAEARRLGDLDAGSHLLVKLAKSAGQAIQDKGGSLIFPTQLDGDVPNKLVARVPANSVEAIAQAAQHAIQERWHQHAQTARKHLIANGPAPDDLWETMWARQVGSLWETYWAAALENGNYQEAYKTAQRAFDATKRTRMFPQVKEKGVKDSLSGRRSALRVQSMSAQAYWAQVAQSPNITGAELRPGGRERLDAIGAIKRWGGLTKGSPSVSYIATADFLEAAKREGNVLSMFRRTVEALLGDRLYRVSNDPDWPYDGDLFFPETLTLERLRDSYGLEKVHENHLRVARDTLSMLYRQVKARPRPYYAIVALDGDGMGEMVNSCLTEQKPEQEHRTFSRKIVAFAEKVRPIVKRRGGHAVYAGGDDVLALAPLSAALPLAQELATEFRNVVGGTASAGIAVAHHLYPLDATLRAAREAEHQAKQVQGKAAVCVRVLKRSGETVDIRSQWDAMGENLERLVGLFQGEALSSKLAYAVSEVAYAFPSPDESFEAELRRLLHRHRHPTNWQESEEEWASRLRSWAACLPDTPSWAACLPDTPNRTARAEELGQWLTLARFVAQGGAE